MGKTPILQLPKEEQEAILQSAIKMALKQGIPADVLEGAEYGIEVIERVARWKKLQKLAEHDQNRIKAGLKPLRDEVMHRAVSEDEED